MVLKSEPGTTNPFCRDKSSVCVYPLQTNQLFSAWSVVRTIENDQTTYCIPDKLELWGLFSCRSGAVYSSLVQEKSLFIRLTTQLIPSSPAQADEMRSTLTLISFQNSMSDFLQPSLGYSPLEEIRNLYWTVQFLVLLRPLFWQG